MGLDATARRRWFGALVLAAALAMLIAGESVLRGRLGDFAFVVYWLACFGLTCLAILIAFLDVRALGRQTRQEQRDLLKTTVDKIQLDAKKKQKRQS